MIRLWLANLGAPIPYPRGETVAWPGDKVVIFSSTGEVIAAVPKSKVKLIMPDNQAVVEIFGYVDEPRRGKPQRCDQCWQPMPCQCHLLGEVLGSEG